jgi:hypothetical protein
MELLRAVSWITAQGGREYVSLCVNTFVANTGHVGLSALTMAVRDNATDPEIGPMLEFLTAAFKGR